MNNETTHSNRDPITGEPGAHPVGTGLGASGGAAAGAAIGMVGGPVGAAVGGVVGAVVGGLVGKGAAEAVNPTTEEAYWRENYSREPYYQDGFAFDEYAPAYRLGFNGRSRYSGEWSDVEPRFASDWATSNAGSTLAWPEARHAARAAWNRVTPATEMSQHSNSIDNVDNSDVIDTLQDLAECCKDGEYGFREAAEQVKRADLKTVLMQRASDCQAAAQELNEHIHTLGGTPDDSGTTAGAMHRGWIAVKTMFSTYDDKAVLNECERGEDKALACYRKALEQPMSATTRQMVERQMQGAKRNHDQIKQLRDSMAVAG